MIIGNPITLGGGGGAKGQPLSSLTEGSLVSVLEGGKLTPFYVAKHDYESDLNGTGRTLLVRKNCHSKRTWNASGVNTYANSDVDTWLNGDYKALLSNTVKAQTGITQFEYTVGGGNDAVTTLARGIFLLSVTEIGRSEVGAHTEGEALPTASALMNPAFDDGALDGQWFRTALAGNSSHAFFNASASSGIITAAVTGSTGVRPCFTLPANMELNTEPYADGSWGLADEADVVPETYFPQLLWTNASPTSAFGAQTISVSGEGFSAYIIECNFNTTYHSKYGKGLVNIGDYVAVAICHVADGLPVTRTISGTTNNSVQFGVGRGSTGNAVNDTGVPTRIWGVKFTL